MQYYDLPESTGYRGEGIAIYTAEQKWNEYEDGAFSEEDCDLAKVLAQAMMEGRPIYNCTGHSIDVPVMITITPSGDILLPVRHKYVR